MSNLIHWEEGLFLQPHHLQRFQKSILDQFGFERSISWAYPYGVIEARLSRHELEAEGNHRIKFERLHVIMPNGCEVNFPEDADLPTLNIEGVLEANPRGFVVYLGVPDWFDTRANTVPDADVFADDEDNAGREKLRYKVVTPDPMVADENTGENEKPIRTRRINACLLLDEHNDNDLQKIPLLQVTQNPAVETPMPRQDPDFVYPCLHLGASPKLRELVGDLSTKVLDVRNQLSTVLSRGAGGNKKVDALHLEQVLRLRTLNKYAARLPSMLDVREGKVPTFSMYLELRDLLGELMALLPGRCDFESLKRYDHDDPYPCFSGTIKQIYNHLEGAIKPEFMKIDFKPGKDDLLTAELDDKHISRANDYFLGIDTSLDRSSLTELVHNLDQFKLAPPPDMARSLRGITLKEELDPPFELPQKSHDRYLYRLAITAKTAAWGRALKQKQLAVKWTSPDLPPMKLTLYMTIDKAADSPSD